MTLKTNLGLKKTKKKQKNSMLSEIKVVILGEKKKFW